MGQGPGGVFSLPGNTEVINNFYGTCTMNLLNGTPFNRIQRKNWDSIAAKAAKRTPDLWAKSTVGERLVFYMTLAHHFGVESVMRVVQGDLSKLPADATGDKLCCAWSRAVQRDLTPYFELWGLPLSKAAYAYTQDWVPWPSADDEGALFSKPLDSRYGDAEAFDFPTCPEDAKTRRQLRAREHFKKTATD